MMHTDIIDELISCKMFSTEVSSKLEDLQKYIVYLEEFKRTANYRINTDFVIEYAPRFSFESGPRVQHRNFMTFTDKYRYAHAKEIVRTMYGRAGTLGHHNPAWEYFDSRTQISLNSEETAGKVAKKLFNWTEIKFSIDRRFAQYDAIEEYKNALPSNSMIIGHDAVYFLNEQDAIVFELKFG